MNQPQANNHFPDAEDVLEKLFGRPTADPAEYGMHFDPNDVEQHQSGAIRSSAKGKGRYDLLSPFALARLAIVMEKGAEQKGDRNWEKGLPSTRYIDSALRHIFQYMMGLEDEDHLGHAMWNIHSAIHNDEMIKRGMLPENLDTLPKYLKGQEND